VNSKISYYSDEDSSSDSSVSTYKKNCIKIQRKSSQPYVTLDWPFLVRAEDITAKKKEVIFPDKKLISEAGGDIRSLKLCSFDYGYGPYYDEDPDYEEVLMYEKYLAFVLKTGTSLKELKLAKSCFEYSLIN
jgi:hypothetical protein